MSRTTNAVASRKRRKKLLKKTKGYIGDRKNHFRLSKDALMKALSYHYEHRKQKKSDFRKLWIIRLNVAAKINGMSYSKLVDGLKRAGLSLNRKILSELAIRDPKAFSEIVEKAKSALAA